MSLKATLKKFDKEWKGFFGKDYENCYQKIKKDFITTLKEAMEEVKPREKKDEEVDRYEQHYNQLRTIFIQELQQNINHYFEN